MDNTMQITIRRINDKMKFQTQIDALPPITLDAHAPFGDDEGYTALELFLISFMDCTCLALSSLMTERMRRTITAMEATVTGTLRDEHPKAFTRLDATIAITSPDATEKEIQRALDSAEKKICPVWAMIKGNVDVHVGFTLERP